MSEWKSPSNARPSGHAPAVYITNAHESRQFRQPEFAEADTYDSGRTSINCATFLPENYAPRYAYPLVVWFHDDGLDERNVRHWLPRISPQNYLGVALRGPIPATDDVPDKARWSTGAEHRRWLEDDLAAVLNRFCQSHSVHPDRIVTAGIGRGGTMALQMLLQCPDWFAGAVVLNAELPAGWQLDWWGQYRGRQLWLGQSDLLRAPSGRAALCSIRTLHAAGIDTTPRIYASDEWPLDTFPREVDWWLMHTLCGDTVIA